ncbi:MAG: formate acetyltransferase [Deltaproteobacteria bacterium]|nr:formate acetyltransferase [Deltaproteobacteria bacterium]
MVFRSFFPDIRCFFRYAFEQLNATFYLINEAGGIGHFLPDYACMINQGVHGYLKSFETRTTSLHLAARIAAEGLVVFADRLAVEAERQAAVQPDNRRAGELLSMARICRKVPREPAETFQEALQSLWITHLAVCLEGINSAISFGRMDQYLYPFYRQDIEDGRLTPEKARELLLCFSAKTTEHVFLLTEKLSKYHGGYLVVQAAIVGGMDKNGKDAANPLTDIFLDVMEMSGLRDPNYQVRLHPGSKPDFIKRAVEVALNGKGVPAFFNDDAVVKSLVTHGYPLGDARNYAIVGCVEQAIPGKSFLSTDAALFNLPVCLEMALNRGRCWNRRRQAGTATRDPATFKSMDDLLDAFRRQVAFMVSRMIKDLQAIEEGNRKYHPTPLSSMLVEGCLEKGRDVTEGGARYNGSGIQCVGVADTADSLAAIKALVFERERLTLEQICSALKTDFIGYDKIRAELIKAPKFGNNHELPDGFAAQVTRIFHKILAAYTNTRGGAYVPGFYSSTSHVAFGEKTGALPSGRHAGMPFAASLGAVNGCDRQGPTALLNSVARVDASLAANGYAVNLRFDPVTMEKLRGRKILAALVESFFASGGMELQVNVLDHEQLEDARRHPGKYPDLVVRVAGYCAYFDDLPNAVKQEVIARTRFKL